jgi:KDO2-lipid IV(A) lauroyltransferase
MHHIWWHTRARFHGLLGRVAVALMHLLRRSDRKRTANVVAAVMRKLGPWLPEHRVGRSNLAAAFPDKSPQEIEAILLGAWDNLGRVAAEFLHLDRITVADPDQPGDADVTYDPVAVERMEAIRKPGPRLFFGIHLGNWELPARFAGPTASIPRSFTARPTSVRSPMPLSNCAPAAWARWCRPGSTRRSGWRGRSSAARRQPC